MSISRFSPSPDDMLVALSSGDNYPISGKSTASNQSSKWIDGLVKRQRGRRQSLMGIPAEDNASVIALSKTRASGIMKVFTQLLIEHVVIEVSALDGFV